MLFPTPGRARRVAGRPAAILLIALLLGQPSAASAFINYTWKAGVSGPIEDSTKWNPAGVPALTDRLSFGVAGTYTATFGAPTPQTGMLTCLAGVVTFRMNATHTTGAFNVVQASQLNSLTLEKGTLNIDYLELGDFLSFSTLNVSGDTRANTTATVRSKGTGNPNSGNTGDQVGHGGISNLNITGGGRYFCDRTGPGTGTMAIAVLPSSSATVFISGSGGPFAQPSMLSLTGGAVLTVGSQGSANLFVANQGTLIASGDVLLGSKSGGNGFATVGSASSTSNATFDAQARLIIGGNLAVANNAGHAEFTVQNRGHATVTDACEIGDPDNDGGSLLRVHQGGTFKALNGLKVWPTAGLGLDLRGGVTEVRGDSFVWPTGKLLSISSTTGTPQFLIENGRINTGPYTSVSSAQLYVGRDGNATMTVRGSGTALTLGPGSTSVGDLAGGTGTLVVDNNAVLTAIGQMVVGNHGAGTWSLQDGARADVGNMTVGTSAGGNGLVEVGLGSQLYVEDKLWIGGGSAGPGGAGNLEVSLGGRLEIEHVNGGVNPALTTIFPAGALYVSSAGLVTTSGDVSCSGEITLEDASIEAQSVTVTSLGRLRGNGSMTAMLHNAGQIDPGFDLNQMQTIVVDGPFDQLAQGHYVVDLDASEGPRSDLLQITGSATLQGVLDLRPEPGFVGVPGHSFRILGCSTRVGSFSSVTWQGQPLDGEVEVVYGDQYVDVVVPGGATGVGQPGPSVISLQAVGTASHPAFALELPTPAQVRVRAFDLRGREIATLFDGSLGATRTSFDLQANTRQLAKGVYFARAEVEANGRRSVHLARVVFLD